MTKRVLLGKYKVVDTHYKFNVGDVVYLVDDDGSANPWFSKLKECERFPHTNSHPVHMSKVECIGKPKFKVGDRVVAHSKTVDGWRTEPRVEDQYVVEVMTVGGETRYTVREDLHGVGGNYYGEEDLTLYKEENEMKPSMTVTRENLSKDKVYVVKQTGGHSFKIGDTLALLRDDNTNSPEFYMLNNKTRTQYVYLGDLKEFGAEAEITELTMQEIADKLNINVETLRIKE